MPSIIVPGRTGRTSFGGPRRRTFTPNAKMEVWNPKFYPNMAAWASTDPLWSARVFVGLSVGQKKSHSVDDVVRVTERVRKKQVGTPDSSFLTQRGLYTSRVDGSIVDEDAVQIIILNLPDFGASPAAFRQQMIELGEELASALKQEEVIVELQKSGIVQETIGVVAG